MSELIIIRCKVCDAKVRRRRPNSTSKVFDCPNCGQIGIKRINIIIRVYKITELTDYLDPRNKIRPGEDDHGL